MTVKGLASPICEDGKISQEKVKFTTANEFFSPLGSYSTSNLPLILYLRGVIIVDVFLCL